MVMEFTEDVGISNSDESLDEKGVMNKEELDKIQWMAVHAVNDGIRSAATRVYVNLTGVSPERMARSPFKKHEE